MRIKSSTPLLTCPQCGKQFAKSYSRAYGCKGCPVLSQNQGGCHLIKCPYCEKEFPG